nr:hypothetical protein CFP56_64512 [Quercus suber]
MMMIGRLGGGGVSVVVDGEDGAEVGHVDDGGSFEDFVEGGRDNGNISPDLEGSRPNFAENGWEIRNNSSERERPWFGSGVTGFERKNRQPTRVDLGWRVQNPCPTAGVIRSGGGGSDTSRLTRLSGSQGLLDTPICGF